jgi:hypothetical protein
MRATMKPPSIRWPAVFLITLGLASVHAGGAPPAESRHFRMGFTPFPHDITAAAMAEMRKFIGDNGDIVCVHLEHVPWTEALSGEPFHPKMMEEWRGKREAVRAGARVYLAVTPADGGRKALAAYRGEKEGMPLPAGFKGKAFDDEVVMKAYLAYCRRAVEYFNPQYLAIGIETNELFHHSPKQWPAYARLHRHVYEALKKDHPDLPVFASLTLHNLVNPGWADRAKMLDAVKADLTPQCDLVGISFYPFMAGYSGREEQAFNWLKKEFGPLGKPFAFAESGQIAQTLEIPSLKLKVEGTPQGQAAFYEKLLTFASANDTAFVISFLYRDYDQMWDKIKLFSPEFFMAWRDCGLIDENGEKRPAYAVWRQYFDRPLRASANEGK